MVRRIFGVVGGLVTWVVVATVADRLLRLAWPAYTAVERAMTFTLPMMMARLAISALATLALGVAARAMAGWAGAAPIAGGLLLAMFLPEHVTIWNKFPIWYHLTFLLSLVPLAFIGAKIDRRGNGVGTEMAR